MCHESDGRPPELPADLALARIAGGAGAEILELQSSDGAVFSAALAESPEAHEPGVLIFPDARGLHPFYNELAERFAQAGHHAIAIDFFGRTVGLAPHADDLDYRTYLRQTTVEQVQADAAAAVSVLRERTHVESVVSVGFCFGGLQSLLAGTSPELGLDGVIAFYGGLDGARWGIRGPIERAAEIRVPVLGLYGSADQGIPVDRVRELESGLEAAGVPHEIEIYDGAPHSFFDRTYDEHAEICQDAWRRVLGFLERIAVGAAA
jgi:carboxymethylenebutenolidase